MPAWSFLRSPWKKLVLSASFIRHGASMSRAIRNSVWQWQWLFFFHTSMFCHVSWARKKVTAAEEGKTTVDLVPPQKRCKFSKKLSRSSLLSRLTVLLLWAPVWPPSAAEYLTVFKQHSNTVHVITNAAAFVQRKTVTKYSCFEWKEGERERELMKDFN